MSHHFKANSFKCVNADQTGTFSSANGAQNILKIQLPQSDYVNPKQSMLRLLMIVVLLVLSSETVSVVCSKPFDYMLEDNLLRIAPSMIFSNECLLILNVMMRNLEATGIKEQEQMLTFKAGNLRIDITFTNCVLVSSPKKSLFHYGLWKVK